MKITRVARNWSSPRRLAAVTNVLIQSNLLGPARNLNIFLEILNLIMLAFVITSINVNRLRVYLRKVYSRLRVFLHVSPSEILSETRTEKSEQNENAPSLRRPEISGHITYVIYVRFECEISIRQRATFSGYVFSFLTVNAVTGRPK